MILHTVTFALNHAPGSPEEKAFLQAAMALEQLPTVKNFHCFRQVSEKNDFDYGLSMEFDTDADYQTYNEHPVHTEFVASRWIPEVARFMELDYVKYEA